MAARPVWRGHLRLALVSCPVAMQTAHHERSNLHFHFINPATGHRVRMLTVDAETEQEVSRRDLARGYEFRKNTYLIMNDDDFEAARIESSATLAIDKFVPADAIDPIYFDAAYYLVPDGEAGQDVYVVLRDAIAKTKRVALSRVVIARRERAVAIMPMGRGLVVHTLHEVRDLNNPEEVFSNVPAIKPEPEMVQLATQLIERQTGEYAPSDMEDRYEARLREVIESRLKGEGIEPEAPEEEDRSNVIDLMAALKKSLQSGAASARSPEKPKRPVAEKPAAKATKAEKPAARKSAAKKTPARGRKRA